MLSTMTRKSGQQSVSRRTFLAWSLIGGLGDICSFRLGNNLCEFDSHDLAGGRIQLRRPMSYFVHPKGFCESHSVGAGTEVWAFAHVLPGAVIGKDCKICDHVFIENDVVLGDRVTVKCGVQLWDGLRVSNDVFIGPNVTFTSDPFPKSKQPPAEFAKIALEEGCSIGANATILPGISIGRNAMVGAGAVVTRSVPPNAIVHGNPARIQGYVSQIPKPAHVLSRAKHEDSPVAVSQVHGVTIHQLPAFEDIRGRLVAAEMAEVLP